MKKFILFLIGLTFLQASIFAQENYWQQELIYNISVKLDTAAKKINASQTLVYKNNSTKTLDFIWFHIYPNAYKNKNTPMMQQILNDASRVEKLGAIDYGEISNLSFNTSGKKLLTSAHETPQYTDIIKVHLSEPLAPGKSTTINSDFTVKLPSYFSRSGYADGQFMITQWYPKPAVFDKDGWHEFPYLDMGEFYSEYADYTVSITVPSNLIVGATGVLQNKTELDQYKLIGTKNTENKEAPPTLYIPAKTATKTLSYTAHHVPDFAWFAAPNMVIQYDTIQLANKKVDAFSFYHHKENTIWNKSIDYIKDATRKYSHWIGEYQYPTVQAFEGPKNNASGGMEYPMITLVTSPDANAERLDEVITHEVGHNWFMSMLGSNERMHTWQDEGLNSYFENRYMAEKYRSNSIFGESMPANLKKLPTEEFQRLIYNALKQIPMNSKIDQPAAAFSTSEDYGLISYIKASMWVYGLESKYGRKMIDEAFQLYFKKWNGKHVSPKDLQDAFEQVTGDKLADYFNKLNKEGGL